MNNPVDIARAYLEPWNAEGHEERLAKLSLWAENAKYQDPLMSGQGREQIAAMIGAAKQQFPGLVFSLHGTPQGHGNNVRLSWGLGPAAGETIAIGTDFVRVDDMGRISEVTGFLDRVPA